MGWEVRVVKSLWNHKYFHEPREVYELRCVYIDDNGLLSKIEVEKSLSISEGSLEDLKRSLEECFSKPVIDEATGFEIKPALN